MPTKTLSPSEIFAAALKLHRDRLRLTQAEVAELLAVSPRVYWQWENAKGDTLEIAREGALRRLRFAPVKR